MFMLRKLQSKSVKQATFPPRPSLAELKRALDTSAATNRNLFIAFNLLLVAALLMCLGLGDEQLLLGSQAIRLPVVGVDLSVWAFAFMMPLLLMVVHFDLMHNLHEHQRKLQTWVVVWEEKHPRSNVGKDGEPEPVMSDEIYPFLYDFAWLHAHGKGPANINPTLRPALCWALYCWAPYTVLVVFLIRFADLQSYAVTAWHLLLIVLDVIWVFWYWQSFAHSQSKFWLWRWLRTVVSGRMLLVGLSTLAGSWTLVMSCLIHFYLDVDNSEVGKNDTHHYKKIIDDMVTAEKYFQVYLNISLVPRLVVPNYRLKLDRDQFHVDKLVLVKNRDSEVWGNAAPLLNLSGRRFGFADFQNALMPRVNFERANLKGAKMDHANFMGANFTEAKLQDADLSNAHLQGTNFRRAGLQQTNLKIASLQGVILQEAILDKTDFQLADLHAADFRGATLLETNFRGAFLQGGILRNIAIENAYFDGASKEGTLGFESGNLDLFVYEWMQTACSTDFLAELMLKHDDKGIPEEISDAALRKWAKEWEKCKPHKDLIEKAILNRINSRAANQPALSN